MVIGQHGLIGHHARQHVLVVVVIDIEIVQIHRHRMVEYHVSEHPLKLMVLAEMRHAVCEYQIFETN